MTDTLNAPHVRSVLDRLLEGAARDDERELDIDDATFAAANARQRSDILQSVYMPISEPGGRLLYLLFLDGWNNLCLPVLRLLEPRLSPGASSWPTT